ncbi:TonB-dependent receptor domain-containing protein, partial [Klebsiella aerogenes]|uniref:TonB-dependent receptor domain-containing protein n=1 Tax=Klebsiella aerogenes TaxID=548 RepID=UPI0013D47978
ASIAPRAQLVNNYEIGIRGRIGAFRGGLAGFVSTSNDGVTFDSVTNQLSQQKEMIYGLEFQGEVAVSSAFTLGTNMTYREGRYDSNKDGRLDSWLPNNRIANPFRGTLYGTYRFDNDVA